MTVALLLQLSSSPATGQLLLFFFIFVIFYFLLFLPMQRRQKKQRRMLEGLKNGDQVVTNGGLVGTIVGLNEDNTLVLRIKPDNVKLLLTRSSVTTVAEEEKK